MYKLWKKIFNIKSLYISLSFLIGFFSYLFVTDIIKNVKSINHKPKKNNELNEMFLNKSVPKMTNFTIEGNKWKLHEQKNKVILLDFWTLSCTPCLSLTENLKKIYNEYKNRNDFIIVGIPFSYDKDLISCYIKVKNVPWIQLIDNNNDLDNNLTNYFEIPSYPSVWIVDKNGVISGVNLKKINQIKAILKELLK